jgi:hypothetical protein
MSPSQRLTGATVRGRQAARTPPIRCGLPPRRIATSSSCIQRVSSDGRLRMDDETVTEMLSILRFSSRGARIETTVKSALQIYRAATSWPGLKRLGLVGKH